MSYYKIVFKNSHIATVRAFSKLHAVKLARFDGITGKLYAKELI